MQLIVMLGSASDKSAVALRMHVYEIGTQIKPTKSDTIANNICIYYKNIYVNILKLSLSLSFKEQN